MLKETFGLILLLFIAKKSLKVEGRRLLMEYVNLFFSVYKRKGAICRLINKIQVKQSKHSQRRVP
jgi:hypothetical protein